MKDSGLLDALLPAFEKQTGIEVGVTAVGTGLALRLARRGEADAVITHDKDREEAFIREGHAVSRRVFATSDFVVVGPAADPAGIRGSTAVEAFRRIAAENALFASRGDRSGTHARELWLWSQADVPRPSGDRYVEVRAGMQTTLQFADERNAYTLTDRATYLARRDRLGLAVLVEGDPVLANEYAVMVIDPGKHPEADRERAQRFADWLLSGDARKVIQELRRAGEPLFELPATATAAAPEGRSPAPAGQDSGHGDSATAGAGPEPGGVSAAPGERPETTVSAAISLREALTEAAVAFEAEHRDATVRLNLGGSGDLRRQIEAGAPVEVFISAGAFEVDELAKEELITPETRREIACNRLVVVVPRDTRGRPRPSSLKGLTAARILVLGAPEAVPAGRYARQALESAGLWDVLAPRMVFAGNVRQALAYVARGEADAGFVYATDARAMADQVDVAFQVDPSRHDPIVYSAVAVTGSRQPDAARGFIEFLTSDAARAVLKKHGFTPAPCERTRPARTSARPR